MGFGRASGGDWLFSITNVSDDRPRALTKLPVEAGLFNALN
jgi:hypothetical protein